MDCDTDVRVLGYCCFQGFGLGLRAEGLHAHTLKTR